MMRVAARTIGVALLAGCAARHHPAAAPLLDRLSPDSVFVATGSVVEVTIEGSGFRRGKPGENTVRFGASVMHDVPSSADGTRIVFVVPESIESGGEAPPARVITGAYPVQVETSSGRSNVLMLRVFR